MVTRQRVPLCLLMLLKKRNVKKSDLNLDTTAEDIKEDEFTCSVCYMILGNTQLAKPRAKVCLDCA